MSDPTIEEDSLISQDDIDKLLDSSSIEAAEEKFLSDDANESSDEELGELSQEDIDSLMNSNISKADDPVEKDESSEDDLQDDDMELISQEDIDQLMNSGTPSDDGGTQSSNGANESSDEELGELSQEDIDSLMNSNISKADDPVEKDESSEDDLQDEAVIVEDIVEAVVDDSLEDEYVIAESEAVDVQESLITQETIDDLIKNFDDDKSSEPVILDKEPASEPEPADNVQPDPVPESDRKPDDQEDTKIDDTEDFLKPDTDVTVLDFDGEGDEDVSQEDIDALLLEPDEEDEVDEDDILISQDDIDTLLMAADQEDEDVLGDLADTEFDSSLDDDLDDEDLLEDESFDDDDGKEGGNNVDQVVLEEEDEDPSEKSKEKKNRAKSQWYKSKLVIACASALVILGITVPLTYFIFFSGESDPGSHPASIANLPAETQRETKIETVNVNVRKPVIDKKPGNMILKDFVVMTSEVSKDLAYVTADISIDYSDQRAYHEIINNLSFYRDLIYDSINKSLISGKSDQITEADILGAVETTLKKVLPGHYIHRVSFKSFKAS